MSYTLKYTGQQIDGLLDKINEIFVAEYGSTIYSEITEAIAAGNQIIVANAGKVYTYAGQDANGGYVFTQSGPDATKPSATYVTLSTGNIWSTSAVDLATLQQFYQSLMEDTVSGSIVSFPDGADSVPVESLTVSIDPIQNLNGYDHPWHDGGGKNKLVARSLDALKGMNTQGTWSGKTYTRSGVAFTFAFGNDGRMTTVTASGTATANAQVTLTTNITLPAANYILNGAINSNQRIFITDGTTYWDDTGSGISFQSADTTYTSVAIVVVSGQTVNNVVFKPMLRLSTETDSTFAPYSNICPIEGHTGAEISVTGINVWDEEWEVGTLNASGQNTPDNTKIRSTNYMAVKAGQTYYVKSPEYLIFCEYDQDKTFIRTNAGIKNTTYTVPEGVFYVRWRTGNNYGTTYNHDISINYPSTDHDYHSGTGNTVYSVSWADEAGTVYGGTLQYLGGGKWKLTALTATVTLTRDNVESYSSSTKVIFCGIRNSTPHTDFATVTADTITKYRSNVLKAHLNTQLTTFSNEFTVNDNANIVIRNDAGFNSIDEGKDFVEANSVQICGLLSTPLEYIIDGPDPATLLGQNNIWADCGEIEELTYRANTALYIQKMLGGSAKTTIASTLSIKKPTAISTADIEQAGEVSEAVEDAEQIEEPEVSEEPPEEITEDPEPVEAEEEPEEEQAAEPEAEQPAEEPAKITEEAKAPVEV